MYSDGGDRPGMISMVGRSNGVGLSYVPLDGEEEENQNGNRNSGELRLVRIQLKPTIIPYQVKPNEELVSKLYKYIEYVLQEFELYIKLYDLVLNNESIAEERVGELIQNLKVRWPNLITKIRAETPKNLTNITQKVKSHCSKSKKFAESISGLITNFSLDNKEVLIQGCVILFKSYEMQLLNSFVDGDNDKALMILASEAVRKIFNTCVKEEVENITLYLIKEGMKEPTSEGKFLEKIFKIKCVHGSTGDGNVDIRDKNGKNHSLNTSKVYTQVGFVKEEEEGMKYFKLKTTNTAKFGYRRLFEGEDLPEHSQEEENKFIPYDYKLNDEDLDLNYNEIIQNAKKHYAKEINDRIADEIDHVKDVKDFGLKIILPLLAMNDDYPIFTEEFITQQDTPTATPSNVTPSGVTLEDVTPRGITPPSVTPSNVTPSIVTPPSITPRSFTFSGVTPSNVTPVTSTPITPGSVTPLEDVPYRCVMDLSRVLKDPDELEPKVFMFQIRDNSPNFTGRDKYLKKISDMFAKNKHFLAITGPANMGKTELALKYAHDHKNEYTNLILLQPSNLNPSLLELSDDFNIPIKKRLLDHIVEDLFALLRNEKTLIILDDIQDTQIIPSSILEESSNIFVLLTTKSKKIQGFDPIQISTLEKTEAYDLAYAPLHKYINMEIKTSMKERQLKELVSKLEEFPISIHLAVGYIIEETKLGVDNPIGDYIKNYKSTLDLDDQKKLASSNRYEKTIIVTLLMALKRIKRFDPNALEVLKVCSYLNRSGLDRQVLYDVIGQKVVDSSLGLLESYHVVEVIQNVVKAHGIILDIIQDLAQTDEYNHAYQKVFQYGMRYNHLVFDEILAVPKDVHGEMIFGCADQNLGLIRSLLEQYGRNELARLYFICGYYGCYDTFREVFKKMEEKKSDFDLDPIGYIKLAGGEYEGWVTPLVCYKGRLDILTFLVDQGASVHTQCRKRYLLHYAAYNGHDDIVQFLLDNEANCNVRDLEGSTILHIAASKGYDHILFTLIGKNIDVNQTDQKKRTALHLSSKHGHVSIVESLTTFNADLNAIDLNEKTPLHYAASTGNLPIVQTLLSHHANIHLIDKNDQTPLHIASTHGHPKIIQLLLELSPNIDQTDHKGRTPLHLATINGHYQTVAFLLNHQAGINLQDDKGNTALHEAAWEGREDIVRLLLSKSAYVDGVNSRGCTPLQKAAEGDHFGVVRLLVDYGADVFHTDFEGRSPLHEAMKNGNKRIVQLLIEKQSELDKSNTEL